MADEPEKSGQEPNLELPSLLSFGRNRKKRKDEAAPEAPAAEEATAASEAIEPRSALAPSTDKAKRRPPVPPPSARPAEPTQQLPVPPPPPTEAPPEVEEPLVVEEASPVVAEAPPVLEEPPVVEEEPPVVEEPEHPGPSFIEPVPAPAPVRPRQPAAVPVDEPLGWPVEDPVAERQEEEVEARAEKPARRPRTGTPLTLPTLNARLASVATGVVVGVIGVLLAYFASRGCETVRGVGSCGGIGLLALLLIVAVQVVLGAIMLQAWKITDPTSTSFLGVGLVAVFVLLFLLSSLESVWMLVVVPVLSGLSFLLSWWVTTAFVEVPGEDARR